MWRAGWRVSKGETAWDDVIQKGHQGPDGKEPRGPQHEDGFLCNSFTDRRAWFSSRLTSPICSWPQANRPTNVTWSWLTGLSWPLYQLVAGNSVSKLRSSGWYCSARTRDRRPIEAPQHIFSAFPVILWPFSPFPMPPVLHSETVPILVNSTFCLGQLQLIGVSENQRIGG